MSITTITGYAAFARARVGSNGDSTGAAECFTGVSATNRASGRKAWTADTSAGFDSGWVSVVWTATTAGGNGSIQWQVNGASPAPVTYAGNQTNAITQLKLQAGVVGSERRASFRNIVIDFFDNPGDTQYAERIAVGAPFAPVASTIGLTDPVDAEVIQPIQPEGSGYQKVRVAADIRLECTDPGLPSEDTIFTDLYLFTA